MFTTTKTTAAAELLGVDLELLDKERLGMAFRRESKACHPDGPSPDAARWAAITAARDTLEGHLSARAAATPTNTAAKGNCRPCAGSGRIRKQRGFGLGVPMMCVMCRGTGYQLEKENGE